MLAQTVGRDVFLHLPMSNGSKSLHEQVTQIGAHVSQPPPRGGFHVCYN